MSGMAKSHLCSTCQKPVGVMHCTGCNAYFCAKDFKNHRVTLFTEMDDVVGEHNNLQEKIDKVTNQNDSHKSLFEQINLWEKITTEKVQQAAAHARQQVLQLSNSKYQKITDKFQSFSVMLADLTESENYVEPDLERLKKMINQFQQELKQLAQTGVIEVNTKESNGLKWDRLINVREKPISPKRQQPVRTVIKKTQPTAVVLRQGLRKNYSSAKSPVIVLSSQNFYSYMNA